MKSYAIAVDGPAGSGKSSVAKEVAKKLDIIYVDTGAMYRAVGFYCMEQEIDTKSEIAVEAVLGKIKMDIKAEGGSQTILVNGQNVTVKIRTQEVGRAASDVAAILAVRKRLVEIQRDLAKESCVIMDGRDIGTNVLPEAEVKIFLTAGADERAKRRCNELKLLGKKVDYNTVKREIIERDDKDMNRKYNPLQKAKDAIEVDTSKMSIEEVVQAILRIVADKIKE